MVIILKKDNYFPLLIIPIILTTIGIILNISPFIYEKLGFVNFIYSVIYCIVWLIIMYYAPKFKKRAIHMSYLIWWFIVLYFSLSSALSNGINQSIIWHIPYYIFVTPLGGLKFLLVHNFFNATVVISGILFIVSLIQAIIFHFYSENKSR